MKNFGLRSSMGVLRALSVGVFVLWLGIGVGRTQYSGTTQNGTGGGPPDSNGLRERQASLREEERQKRLVADTEKLLTLATQLHDDVAKTNKNILSLNVVKRADEIEKLAHSLKEAQK